MNRGKKDSFRDKYLAKNYAFSRKQNDSQQNDLKKKQLIQIVEISGQLAHTFSVCIATAYAWEKLHASYCGRPGESQTQRIQTRDHFCVPKLGVRNVRLSVVCYQRCLLTGAVPNRESARYVKSNRYSNGSSFVFLQIEKS